MSGTVPCKVKHLFSRAQDSDVEEIFALVNSAYDLEEGERKAPDSYAKILIPRPPKTCQMFLRKYGPNPATFSFIFIFFKHTLQFLQQINMINAHPLYGAGIRTHNLWNMSLLP